MESKRIAMYARLSLKKQDTDLSISTQVRVLKEFAARNNCEIVREFVDKAENSNA